MGNWCTSRENGKTKIKVTYQSVNITLVQGTFLDVETTCFINAAVNPLVATVRTQLQQQINFYKNQKKKKKGAKIKSNLRRNLKINQQTKHQNPKINNNNNRLVIQNKENRCKHNHRNNPVKFLFIKKKLSKKIDFQNLFFLIVKSFKNLYKINMSSSTTKFHKTLQKLDVFSILPNILNSAFTSAETSNYIHVGIPEELFKLVTNKTPQEVASLSLSTVTSYIDSRGADLKLKDIKITIHTDELFKAFEDEFAKLSGDKKQQQPELKQQQVQKPEQEVLPNAEKVPEDQQPDVQKLPDELKQQPEPDHQQQQQQQQPQDVHQADQQP